jgi:hypothetical protein
MLRVLAIVAALTVTGAPFVSVASAKDACSMESCMAKCQKKHCEKYCKEETARCK